MLISMFGLPEKQYHGCNQGPLHVVNEELLIEGDSNVDSPIVVYQIFDELLLRFIQNVEGACMCIPVHPVGHDERTRVLIRSLNSKDKEARGFRDLVSDAPKTYINYAIVDFRAQFVQFKF